MKKIIAAAVLASTAVAAHAKVVASGPNPDAPGGKLLLSNESCQSRGMPFNTVQGVYITATDAKGVEVARGCYLNEPGTMVVTWFRGDGSTSEARYHSADYRDLDAPQVAAPTQMLKGRSPVCDHLPQAMASFSRAAKQGVPLGLAYQQYKNDPTAMDLIEIAYRVETAGMDPAEARGEIRKACAR